MAASLTLCPPLGSEAVLSTLKLGEWASQVATYESACELPGVASGHVVTLVHSSWPWQSPGALRCADQAQGRKRKGESAELITR